MADHLPPARKAPQAANAASRSGGGERADALNRRAEARLGPFTQALGRREQRAESPRPSGGVVQGKFRYRGFELTDKTFEKNPLPERPKAYFQSAMVFDLRDDWDLGAPEFHVIHPEYVYLLGETHGSGEWEKQTRHWPGIAKMNESLKALPGVKPKGMKKQENPLENLHAFLLHACLIGKSSGLKLKASQGAPALAVVEDIAWAAGQVVEAEPSYKKWVGTLSKDHLEPVEDAFLDSYVTLGNDAQITQGIAQNLAKDLKKKATDKDSVERVALARESLAKQVDFFAAMATALSKVLRLTGGTKQKVDAEIGGQQPVAPKDSAGMGPREEAMVANIKGGPRPLLVQIGDGHVESVGGQLSKVVKVRVGHKLDQATKI